MSSTRSAVLKHHQAVLDDPIYVLYQFNVFGTSNQVNPFVTSGTYMSHLQRVFFQIRSDNSIPLFLHAAIYLEVSLYR